MMLSGSKSAGGLLMGRVPRTPLPRHTRYENLEVARQRRRLHHDQLQETGTPPCLQVGSFEPAAPPSSNHFILHIA